MAKLKVVLQFLKKHMISLIFGVIAVLAVVARFWPITGMYNSLQTELNERVDVERQIESLLASPRHMPLLSPDQTDQAVLDVFPTQPVIDAGKTAVAQVTKQADGLVQAAVNINQHAPLYPNELPKPDDPTKYNFAQAYIKETTNYARWQNILNSCARPTPEEITAATNQQQSQIFGQFGVVPGGPDSPALREAEDQFAAATATLKPDMEMARSKQFSIYLEPGALPYDQTIGIGAGKLPEAGQIWDAQLGLWIVDDVTRAIARINQEYSDPSEPNGPPTDDILHAPVKEIERLQNIVQCTAGTTNAASDLQAGVGSATPVEPTVSSTGRVCNALYDVYRFDLKLDVDAAKIPQILRDLQLQQFITVLNVQILEVVDPAQAVSNGFRFGDKPVVRLEIDGEDLLMKNWTADLLPDARKAAGTGGVPNNSGASQDLNNNDQ
jgi:hypothetical protein